MQNPLLAVIFGYKKEPTALCNKTGKSLPPQKKDFPDSIGHPQTCVYPDVCLGIAHVLPGQGVWQIHNVSALFAKGICRAKGADTFFPEFQQKKKQGKEG